MPCYAIAGFDFDAVWFMGVWERSPAGIAIANQNKNLVEDFRRALPDFRPEDNVGPPRTLGIVLLRLGMGTTLQKRPGIRCLSTQAAAYMRCCQTGDSLKAHPK